MSLNAEPLDAAFDRLERHDSHGRIAADATSIDLYLMTQAGPAGRAGLTTSQDTAVSQLRATEIGAVLAHPPGSGKTVIVASALNEDLARNCVIMVPSGVIGQWKQELQRWAPDRTVTVGRRYGQLPDSLGPGSVLLTSHDLGARWLDQLDQRIDDLVCDEAVVLLGGSPRASRLRKARCKADRAWALTGTPGERSGDRAAAALAEWARNAKAGSVQVRSPSALSPVLLLPCLEVPVPQVISRVEAVRPTHNDRTVLDDAARLAAGSSRLNGIQLAHVRTRAQRASSGMHPGSGKAEAVAALAAQYKGAVLVCADSRSALLDAVEAARTAGVPAAVLESSSRAARAQLLASFASGSVRLLAVSPGSQRGVNLQAAGLVIHMDIPGSRSEFDQRNGRAARMGSRSEHVESVLLAYEGTWDWLRAQAFLQGDGADALMFAQQGNWA